MGLLKSSSCRHMCKEDGCLTYQPPYQHSVLNVLWLCPCKCECVCVCVCVWGSYRLPPSNVPWLQTVKWRVTTQKPCIDRDLHNMYILISRLLCLGGGEPGTRYCVPYHNATTTDSITNRGWGWTLCNELACLTYPLQPVGVVTWLPRQGLAPLLYTERIISQLPVQPQMQLCKCCNIDWLFVTAIVLAMPIHPALMSVYQTSISLLMEGCTRYGGTDFVGGWWKSVHWQSESL